MNGMDRIVTGPSTEYDLAGRVIGLAMQIHTALGPGFLESVYQRALLIELKTAGLPAVPEYRIEVKYRGITVGEFAADIIVDDKLIIENKAIESITTAHQIQLVNYLAATGIDDGLLLNFGARKLQFKRKYRLGKTLDAPF